MKLQRRAKAHQRSIELKDQGNSAFMNKDFKTAFVIYTACMHLSKHQPLYPLNRAGAALSLKMYHIAALDASTVIEKEKRAKGTASLIRKLWTDDFDFETAIAKGDLNSAKAHFRRAQAVRSAGRWDKADEDYALALTFKPGDSMIEREMEELKRLRELSPEEQTAWVAGQAKVEFLDIFEEGELKRRTEEVLGHRLDEIDYLRLGCGQL
ncbi:hypothetical protein C8R43DRAFT_1033010 [Mycena crocata]|nr:hypothetical protein C8R43DRAFT_1033010 [Mycena crocata]